jgi:hypothetical protein
MFQLQIHPGFPVSIVCVVPPGVIPPQLQFQFHVQLVGWADADGAGAAGAGSGACAGVGAAGEGAAGADGAAGA